MSDQPLLAEIVGQHLAAHPHFIKGYNHGIKQEREHILNMLRNRTDWYTIQDVIDTLEGETE